MIKIEPNHSERINTMGMFATNKKLWRNRIDVLALEREGKLLLREKKWQQAEGVFSRLLDCSEVFWIYLGQCLLGQKKYKEAKECFEKILPQCTPQTDGIYSLLKGLGFCHYHLGDVWSAEENFNKALALKKNENDIDLLMGYGLIFKEQKKYQQAKKKFQSILEIDSTHANAWAGLAEVRACLGDFELAYFTLKQALDFDPNNKIAIKTQIRWMNEFQIISGRKQMFHFQL